MSVRPIQNNKKVGHGSDLLLYCKQCGVLKFNTLHCLQYTGIHLELVSFNDTGLSVFQSKN